MLWILFSILAASIWAVVNIIDKYILTKYVRNPIVPVIILGIVGVIASFLIYLLHGFSILSFSNIVLSFIAGAFYILGTILYFKAAKIEEISRVIPLIYLSPLFVLVLAAIFLGEIFTPTKYFGIFLLVIGAVLISLKNFTKFSFGKAFWFMILASLAFSINVVIMKYLLNFADFWTVFSYIRIGTFLASIPLFYFNLSDLLTVVKEHGKKAIGVMSLSEILNLIGVLFITIATASGYVTLVNALSSTQPFFVLLFTIILSIFYPKVLKEEINKSTVLIKLISIVLIFMGIILIT